MSEREVWQALVSMVGKPDAYHIAHVGEYDARPFWSEACDPHERLSRWTARVLMDSLSDTTTRKEA